MSGDIYDVREDIYSKYVDGKPTIKLRITGKLGKTEPNPDTYVNGYRSEPLTDKKKHLGICTM